MNTITNISLADNQKDGKFELQINKSKFNKAR